MDGDAGVFTLRRLFGAYKDCRRGKHSCNTLRYASHLIDNLVTTRDDLLAARWHPRRSVSFVVTKPKAREIHAADFSDRVVHHLLVTALEPLFEPLFIDQSYANRKRRGTHAAVDYLQASTVKLAHSDGAPGYFMQLDIRNFFNCINRRTLFGLVDARLDHAARYCDPARPARHGHAQLAAAVRAAKLSATGIAQLRWLTRALLTGNAGVGAIARVGAAEYARVPSHKRLINSAAECGLPIGNLTSQFFANVYLNQLDQFIKHTLGCTHYVRYVDDFVLLHGDQAVLGDFGRKIEKFLQVELGLTLREPPRVAAISCGIDFLGYVVRPTHRLVRRRVVGALKACVDLALKRHVTELANGTLVQVGRASANQGLATPWKKLQAQLSSYLGHLQHADSHRLVAAVASKLALLKGIIEIAPYAHDASALNRPCYGAFAPFAPKGRDAATFIAQCRYFLRQTTGVLLMQRGHAIWIYRLDMQHAALHLGALAAILKVAPTAAEQAMLMPMRACPALVARLRKVGLAYDLVVEDGQQSPNLKCRVIAERFRANHVAKIVGWAKQSVPTANVAQAPRLPRSAYARVGTLRFAYPTQALVNCETPILAWVSGHFVCLDRTQNLRTLVGWAKQSVPEANVAPARMPLRSAHIRVGTLRFAHPTQALVNRETPMLARVLGRFIHLKHPQNSHTLVGWAKQSVPTAVVAPARMPLRSAHIRVGTLRFAHPTRAAAMVGWVKQRMPTHITQTTAAPRQTPIPTGGFAP